MNKYVKYLFSLLLFFIPCTTLLSHDIKKKTICLNMIVKDESHIIERCLKSVLPIIDYWVIVDTGSTDPTKSVIEHFLSEIPGELHERPWVNFGHNRDEALQLAKNKADYILFMDADDALVFEKDFVMPDLLADCYSTVSSSSGGATEYHFTRLIKADLDWHWYGVLHEYAYAPNARDYQMLPGVTYAYLSGGARSKDPTTYQKDVEILKSALLENPFDSRYTFYLAQTYACLKQYEEAIKMYQRRVELGGWEEEVFWSKLQIAIIQGRLAQDEKIVLSSFCDAYLFRKSRAEPLYYIGAMLRIDGDNETAYQILKQGLKLPLSSDRLFVEKWIYEYGMLFEYSIASYWVGKYQESLNACDKLLEMDQLPKTLREWTLSNREFAVQKVEELKSQGQDNSTEIEIDKPLNNEKLPALFATLFKQQNGNGSIWKEVRYFTFPVQQVLTSNIAPSFAN